MTLCVCLEIKWQAYEDHFESITITNDLGKNFFGHKMAIYARFICFVLCVLNLKTLYLAIQMHADMRERERNTCSFSRYVCIIKMIHSCIGYMRVRVSTCIIYGVFIILL